MAGQRAPRIETELCPAQGAPNQATFMWRPRLVHTVGQPYGKHLLQTDVLPPNPRAAQQHVLLSDPGTKLRPGPPHSQLTPISAWSGGAVTNRRRAAAPRSPDGPANHSPPPRDFATLSCLGQPLGLNTGSVSSRGQAPSLLVRCHYCQGTMWAAFLSQWGHF